MDLLNEAEEQRNRIAAGRAILGREPLDPDFWALQQLKQRAAAAIYRTYPAGAVFHGIRKPGGVTQLVRRRARNRVAGRSRVVNRQRAA